MPACDLSIQLAQGDTYRPGERIRGIVRVRVDDKCKCKALTLTLGWWTHGRGNRASGNTEKFALFSGEWQPGKDNVYPFDFLCPAGPYSYHGHVTNLDWKVHAHADLPWKLDSKAEAEIIVAQPIRPAAIAAAAGPLPPVPASPAKMGAAIGGLMLLFGLGLIASWLFADGDALFPGIFLSVVGGLIAFFSVRNTIAQMKLGPVTLYLPAEVGPGQRLRGQLKFTPRSQVKVNGITAKLTGTESAVSGSGTNTTTHTHPLHNAELALSPARTFAAGQPVSLPIEIPLPEKAPCSFKVNSNSVEWSAVVHIDIAGSADWMRAQAINVRPMAG